MQKTGTLKTAVTGQHLLVRQAVKNGLSNRPKQLPSWLFYDDKGDRIFQAIMEMPEYYPTNCEYEIFKTHQQNITAKFADGNTRFLLAELGAGDGMKTEVLLRYLVKQDIGFSYHPVDVSETVLAQLQQRLSKKLPQLEVQPLHAHYNEGVERLHELGKRHRLVYIFLGANIGNFGPREATEFVRGISRKMKKEDLLLIGFDLKKDPRVIQAAYDDPHGITSDFNLNLLTRINRELGACFNLDRFKHYAYYNPETGEAKSYLISTCDQEVYIKALEQTFCFAQWEPVYTEVSQKFDMEMIESLARQSRLKIDEVYYDSKGYFCDVLFKK